MKSAVFGSSLLVSLLSFMPVYASLTGSGRITPQDYINLPPIGLENNPPACGMSYSTLDLGRITAVQGLVKSTDCNKCIKVVNTENNKFIYALAVDLGGVGLDLSIPSFKELFGQQYDASPASWSPTDYSNCAGIYSKGDGSSNSTTTTTKKSATRPTKTKSSSHLRPTTTKVIKKSTNHPRPTKVTKKPTHHPRPTSSKVTKKPTHHPRPTKVKKPSTLARPTNTKTKSAGHPAHKNKSAGHPAHKTKSAGHSAHKTKSPGRGCQKNKKTNPKKHSTAGRRKHQGKQH